ncbi:hypothetical protein SRABI128_03949 [Microbacterium sp. Bi128]|nr:hypothetical protein SRABI128_03949 [Microbacterium sp. Bi128]
MSGSRPEIVAEWCAISYPSVVSSRCVEVASIDCAPLTTLGPLSAHSTRGVVTSFEVRQVTD